MKIWSIKLLYDLLEDLIAKWATRYKLLGAREQSQSPLATGRPLILVPANRYSKMDLTIFFLTGRTDTCTDGRTDQSLQGTCILQGTNYRYILNVVNWKSKAVPVQAQKQYIYTKVPAEDFPPHH